MPTAKPFSKLKRNDLEQSPIWQWLQDDSATSDGELADESFVEPTQFKQIPMAEFRQFIVSANIHMKASEPMPGLCEVTVANGKVTVNPVLVFMLDRQLSIPAVETNRLLSRYTHTLENFPTGWALKMLVEGESKLRYGNIKGGDMNDLVAIGLEVLASLKSLRSQ